MSHSMRTLGVRSTEQGGIVMLVQVLLALLADAVFESAASKDRAIASDVARYFERRGFESARATRPSPTR
jgi:hypothetical protein